MNIGDKIKVKPNTYSSIYYDVNFEMTVSGINEAKTFVSVVEYPLNGYCICVDDCAVVKTMEELTHEMFEAEVQKQIAEMFEEQLQKSNLDIGASAGDFENDIVVYVDTVYAKTREEAIEYFTKEMKKYIGLFIDERKTSNKEDFKKFTIALHKIDECVLESVVRK